MNIYLKKYGFFGVFRARGEGDREKFAKNEGPEPPHFRAGVLVLLV
jgi:hypothetical protein